MSEKLEVATIGGGCFWCTEAVFQRLEGVHKVVSGYAGGHVVNPNYRDICSGDSGHAEVIQIHFDPQLISFSELLEVFWTTHDPTTLNRQGADRGTQYRSVIFHHDEEQRAIAQRSITEHASQLYSAPIVTELSELPTFYVAEPYHQDYYNQNSTAGYCRAVINPKIAKLRQKYASKLKASA